MITLLLVALAGAIMLQPTRARCYASVIYVGELILHDAVLGAETGLLYYLTAAAGSTLVIVFTGAVTPVPALIVRLHWICLISIVLNFYGWLIWLAYWEPVTYNAAFVLLYVAAFLALIKRDRDDVGGIADNRRGISFFSTPRVRLFYVHEHADAL